MKSLQELFQEILASDEMKLEFAEAVKSEAATAEFLKTHDCGASVSDLAAFLKEQLTNEKELSEQEMEQIAGGDNLGVTVMTSFFLVGVCMIVGAATATASTVTPGTSFSECLEQVNNVIHS